MYSGALDSRDRHRCGSAGRLRRRSQPRHLVRRRIRLDRRLTFLPGGVRFLSLADGRTAQFLFTSPLNVWVDMDLRMVDVAGTTEVIYHDGTVDVYTGGVLTAIRKRNGYTQTLSYDGTGKLTTVTDSYGRQITLTYHPNGLIAAATGPDNRTVSYTYKNTVPVTSAYVLETVTYPDDTPANPNDNPRVTYHHENANFPYALTGLTDERGIRYLAWEYDANGRAVRSERAGGVDRVTITFNANGTVTTTNALGNDTIYTITSPLLVRCLTVDLASQPRAARRERHDPAPGGRANGRRPDRRRARPPRGPGRRRARRSAARLDGALALHRPGQRAGDRSRGRRPRLRDPRRRRLTGPAAAPAPHAPALDRGDGCAPRAATV